MNEIQQLKKIVIHLRNRALDEDKNRAEFSTWAFALEGLQKQMQLCQSLFDGGGGFETLKLEKTEQTFTGFPNRKTYRRTLNHYIAGQTLTWEVLDNEGNWQITDNLLTGDLEDAYEHVES